MRAQSEHHEVGVEPVKAVARLDVVVRLAPLVTDELHDLVLAFTRHLDCSIVIVSSDLKR